MVSSSILNLVNESLFFNEKNILTESLYFHFDNSCFFSFLADFDYNFLQITFKKTSHSKHLLNFINQIEHNHLYNNIENITAIYHYSIPNTKLFYPEPFIAAPSFMHSDLWFVHILIYQYWLWFVFVFIIVFFFITFICTIRWCNMRVRPRRETRGVSRSKCGDLITACVPVSWATSIIVNESTDAIDYYDGFGTTELVVGIRAYQWGWEYYYPKDIDLNYNIKANYSSFIGNSLKYSRTTDVNINANNLWKFYQNKNTDNVVTPAHALVLPMDNYKLFNFLNFNDIGSNSSQEVNSFKKVRMFSKTLTSDLFFIPNNFSNKYKFLSNLYFNSNSISDSYLYGIKRQHNFLSLHSTLNNQSTFLNLKSANKIINFNFKNTLNFTNKSNQTQSFNFLKKNNNLSTTNFALKLNNLLKLKNLPQASNSFNEFSLYNNLLSLFNNSSEQKKIHYAAYKLLNSNFKFSSEFNPLNNYLTTNNQNFELNNINFFNLFKSNWAELVTSNKFVNSKINADYPYSPIVSNHPLISSIDYDNYKRTDTVENSSNSVIQEKEETISPITLSVYWNTLWASSNFNWRIYSNWNYHNIHKFFYLPTFSFYYDYDFRNWQMAQLLEDSVWESVCSAYTHDEYVNLTNDFYEYEYFKKWSNLYNLTNKFFIFTDRIADKSYFKDTAVNEDYYANNLYLEDFTNPLNLVPTKDFSIYPLFYLLNNIDDSYESLKTINNLFNLNNKIYLIHTNFGFQPQHFFSVFDMFRSDIDDFSWFSDESNLNIANNKFSTVMIRSSDWLNSFSNEFQIFFFKNFNFNPNLLDSQQILNLNANWFINDNLINSNKTNRFSNNLNIRAPVKNAMVTHSSLQKVFRTRFDENRSHAKLTDLSYSYEKQPFVDSSRVNYENLLGKTKENFFKNNLFKNNFKLFINNFYEISTSLNYYFFDFPFLLALKSDASRYMWFDWFAKWGFYEVQPSSSSRYAIYGMPYLSKNFEFNGANSETLNESETYLLRIARARRNYITNWTFTPYFYARNKAWFQNNLINEIMTNDNNLLISTNNLLNNMHWYWTKFLLIDQSISQFFPSNSSTNSYSKMGWKPKHSIQSYYYSAANLVDILTKREFLYRELFSANNSIINLPNFLTNSPSNPLINEVKSSFLFVDPIIFNNEYSKNTSQASLSFFNFIVLKTYLQSFGKVVNFNFITDLLFYYFMDNKQTNLSKHNEELYKNQYRPMRKGVSNMIRLHATGAVAMPIELRLQILASSKDVIHSWAIPSAGIKIDCVPGYSSHKVMIFLVSGIFWGQCMEICGRYHHWMPIVIYFMKRDLFFLWCTHFVFLTGANNMWTINDRQFVDYVRLASFDKYSWLTELSN